MKAQAGDRIVVERPRDDLPARKGVVLKVQGDNGGPPYWVRWEDEGRETLVYPGPDARIEPRHPVPQSPPGAYGGPSTAAGTVPETDTDRRRSVGGARERLRAHPRRSATAVHQVEPGGTEKHASIPPTPISRRLGRN